MFYWSHFSTIHPYDFYHHFSLLFNSDIYRWIEIEIYDIFAKTNGQRNLIIPSTRQCHWYAIEIFLNADR